MTENKTNSLIKQLTEDAMDVSMWNSQEAMERDIEHPYWEVPSSWPDVIPISIADVWNDLSAESKLVAYIIAASHLPPT